MSDLLPLTDDLLDRSDLDSVDALKRDLLAAGRRDAPVDLSGVDRTLAAVRLAAQVPTTPPIGSGHIWPVAKWFALGAASALTVAAATIPLRTTRSTAPSVAPISAPVVHAGIRAHALPPVAPSPDTVPRVVTPVVSSPVAIVGNVPPPPERAPPVQNAEPAPPIALGNEPLAGAMGGSQETSAHASAGAAGAPKASSLSEEAALLERAREALAASTPNVALGFLDDYRARFPLGELVDEATVLRVKTLLAAGREDDARRVVDAFGRERPSSPYLSRIRGLVAPGPKKE